MKPIIAILAVVSLGLGVVLLLQHRKATEQIQRIEAESQRLTADRDAARTKLEESVKVTTRLEADLAERTKALTTASTDLSKANEQISQTSAEMAKVQADYNTSLAEAQKQTVRITELEGQR